MPRRLAADAGGDGGDGSATAVRRAAPARPARSAGSARPARPAADARPAAVLQGLPFALVASGAAPARRPAVVLRPAPPAAPARGPAIVVPVERLSAFLAPFDGIAALPGVAVALDAWVDGRTLPVRPDPPPAIELLEARPACRPRHRKIRLRRRTPPPPPTPAARPGRLARLLGLLRL